MHHKNIKAMVRKQLKSNYRNWNRLNKKAKKRVAKMVLDEVVKDYDFSHEIKTTEPELLGIENQLPTPGIMNLEGMETFINSHKNDVLFKLNKHKRHATYLKDEELRIIDDILDDQIINKLLSYAGYTPSMRGLFPSNYLRAELLKSIKYPEISYRKFCGDDKTYKCHKENSGLPILIYRFGVGHLGTYQLGKDVGPGLRTELFGGLAIKPQRPLFKIHGGFHHLCRCGQLVKQLHTRLIGHHTAFPGEHAACQVVYGTEGNCLFFSHTGRHHGSATAVAVKNQVFIRWQTIQGLKQPGQWQQPRSGDVGQLILMGLADINK